VVLLAAVVHIEGRFRSRAPPGGVPLYVGCPYMVRRCQCGFGQQQSKQDECRSKIGPHDSLLASSDAVPPTSVDVDNCGPFSAVVTPDINAYRRANTTTIPSYFVRNCADLTWGLDCREAPGSSAAQCHARKRRMRRLLSAPKDRGEMPLRRSASLRRDKASTGVFQKPGRQKHPVCCQPAGRCLTGGLLQSLRSAPLRHPNLLSDNPAQGVTRHTLSPRRRAT
jgi:hypothetical protein